MTKVIATAGADELVLEDDGKWTLRTFGYLPIAATAQQPDGRWIVYTDTLPPFWEDEEADAVCLIWHLAGE